MNSLNIGRPVQPVALPFNTVPDYRKMYKNQSPISAPNELQRRTSHHEPLQRFPTNHPLRNGNIITRSVIYFFD